MITEEMVKAVLKPSPMKHVRIQKMLARVEIPGLDEINQRMIRAGRTFLFILVPKQMLSDLISILLEAIPDLDRTDRLYLAYSQADVSKVAVSDMTLIERDKALLLARAFCKRRHLPIHVYVDCLKTFTRLVWLLFDPRDRDIPPLERLDKILAIHERLWWQFWRKPLPK